VASRAGFLLGLFFDPEDRGDVPPKRLLTFKGLHSVISQKIELFITTAVGTSNPTSFNFFKIIRRERYKDVTIPITHTF
jgi:hypothetical protein